LRSTPASGSLPPWHSRQYARTTGRSPVPGSSATAREGDATATSPKTRPTLQPSLRLEMMLTRQPPRGAESTGLGLPRNHRGILHLATIPHAPGRSKELKRSPAVGDSRSARNKVRRHERRCRGPSVRVKPEGASVSSDRRWQRSARARPNHTRLTLSSRPPRRCLQSRRVGATSRLPTFSWRASGHRR
jgi:hypothetical protein